MIPLRIQCQGRPVRNLFQEAAAEPAANSAQTRGTALLLPGAYYSSQAPGMHFLRETLLRAGFDTLAIDYHYFLAGEPYSEASRTQALAEAEAAYLHLVGRADSSRDRGPRSERFLIAGKSLGSILAVRLALDHRASMETDLVLLTPVEARIAALFAQSSSPADARTRPWRLFAVRCAPDEARDEAAWKTVVPAFREVTEVSLARTTHGMDSLDGPAASLHGLARMCTDLERWLSLP
ncbi:MAG: hypothetical protein KBD56_08595 [Candidatus Eisenbacteria bacterium]|nr:hypothetical protein [Candidatus Eisenbacteria bacterium]